MKINFNDEIYQAFIEAMKLKYGDEFKTNEPSDVVNGLMLLVIEDVKQEHRNKIKKAQNEMRVNQAIIKNSEDAEELREAKEKTPALVFNMDRLQSMQTKFRNDALKFMDAGWVY